MVRRIADALRGGPLSTFDADGRWIPDSKTTKGRRTLQIPTRCGRS
jgi:hypothetical protein